MAETVAPEATLREAGPEDLSFILELEANPAIRPYILPWDKAAHLARLAEPDSQYLIGENATGAVGFAILAGVANPHRAVELVRIAVREPGSGLGLRFLLQVMDYAFSELAAHRLWLDVMEHNSRARHVYEKAGFVREGVLREAVFAQKRFVSLVVMSVLEWEWRKQRR